MWIRVRILTKEEDGLTGSVKGIRYEQRIPAKTHDIKAFIHTDAKATKISRCAAIDHLTPNVSEAVRHFA